MKVTVTRSARLDPRGNFFTTGSSEKLVYCAGRSVPRARPGWAASRPSSTAATRSTSATWCDDLAAAAYGG